MENDSRDSGVASAGKSMSAAISGQSQGEPRRLVIRRTAIDDGRPQRQQPSVRREGSSGPLLRRTGPGPGGNAQRRVGDGRGQAEGQARGPLLRRTGGPPGGPPGGSFLRRAPGAGGARAGGRPGAPGAQRSKPNDRPRRREGGRGAGDEPEIEGIEGRMDEYITKYVDRPPNPTEPLPYTPAKLTLEDLKADWPNTPLTSSGITQSVIQRIEWLARRLPHGFQYPEQIVEHYLKGNLTRFESTEEKEAVLKLAKELTAKSKEEFKETVEARKAGDKTKPFIYPGKMRFQMVKDADFQDLSTKDGEKQYLISTGIRGDYGEVAKQRYPFLQNAARMLNNNSSYGPVQMQKVLDRVQMLIPQRGAAQRQAANA